MMEELKIDLANYPHLQELSGTDVERFGKLIRTLIMSADKAVANKRLETSKQIYKMEYEDLLLAIADTFFNPPAIVEQHANQAEQVGLSYLDEDIHPLTIFTNNTPVYNVRGEIVSPDKWIPLDDFNVQDWLYALLYGARFVSWKELAEYLTLGKYDLIEVLKARNFKQLQKIQPALNYQDKRGITKGKLIQGTGYIECGSKYHEICPACEEGIINHKHSRYSYCPKCSAGFIK